MAKRAKPRDRRRNRGQPQHPLKKALRKKLRSVALSQLDLPAGYLVDSVRHATLREVIDPRVPTRPMGALSHHELAELVLARLETDPTEFKIRMLDTTGVIDRQRAIEEVRARTPIGSALMNIEMRFVRLLTERERGGHGKR